MEGGKDEQAETEDFRGSEVFCMIDTTMVDTCHHVFVKTHRMNNTRVDHNVNYGLWVTMMCQCRFTNCHKYTTLVGDVDSQGEAVQVWRQYIGKSLNHLLPFCYEPKTALKKFTN